MKGKILAFFLAVFWATGLSPKAQAEKFTIGFQPYDTISYQVAVNAELGLWKKYMPEGTELEFTPALQGSIVANNMLAGKAVAGYMSIMPATILASKDEQAEIKIAASLGMSEGTRCSVVLVRKDAPQFKSVEELARWLDGKTIAAPKGSASDQYLRRFFNKHNVKPKEYLNQSIEVIATNFRIGKLDAASVWEPTVSRIADNVGEGYVRIAADGSAADNYDLGVLVLRNDFIQKNPAAAKGYVRSELEAQRYLLDPANQKNVIEMVAKYATGIDNNVLWYSIYGQVPADRTNPIREWKSFYFNKLERENIEAVAPFLYSEKVIDKPKLKDWVVDDSIAREVFKEAGYAPVDDEATLGYVFGAKAEDSPFK
ncbi:MAG: ABC transporter substrate-binding protein [Deltaproteobacteria bacterium]|jgi:NitT/TauT family transport system substrate-binding protein|nr:ABC transporter substrate-binding protein [Deltaproteobacteria bacterium]